MIWLFGLLIIFIIILDIPGLIKNKSYKEAFIYMVFLIFGVYMGIVQIYEMPYYNPILELATYWETY